MNVKAISRNVGFALLVSALFMFLSILVSLHDKDEALVPLMISFILTFTIGIFPFIFVHKNTAISLKDGYLIITLSWLMSFVFGMLPYALWGGPFSLANAWFESVSGFTTTGATILDDMMREDDFSRLELDLKGCVRNYRYFRSLLEPSTKLLVLVKANAYGHGAVEFGAMMQRAGADYLAVAYPVEGLELRENGISLPIIVLTAGTDFYPEIVKTRMEPSIPNLESLDAFCTYLIHERLHDYPIHIKLDTGMHRLGFNQGSFG